MFEAATALALEQSIGIHIGPRLVDEDFLAEHQQVVPEVIIVPDLPEDQLARKRAERLIRTADQAGPLVVGQNTEIEAVAEQGEGDHFVTQLDMLRAAAAGNEVALRGVKKTVLIDMTERSFKAGHVTRVELEADNLGGVRQYGQSMDDVHINALRYASGRQVIRLRSEAETRNNMRIKPNIRTGRMETHYWVVLSRCAVDMTDKELQDCCFFADTKSCAIQVIGMENGQLFQETAFVSGVAELGGERHDAESVEALGRGLGVDLGGLNPTELLDTPLLIPREMMPNGVIDLVKLYDNSKYFFGQNKPTQDYERYLETCRQREASMQPIMEEIVQTLLTEVSSMQTPTDATERIGELSAQHLVVLASKDRSIDARVFGAKAAPEIIAARLAYARGDMDEYNRRLETAQKVQASFTCPTSANRDAEGEEAANAAGSKTERKNWKTKQGVCVVRSCPTRPGETEVGPCGVCMDRCQLIFDDGGDPTGGAIILSLPTRKAEKTASLATSENKPAKVLRLPGSVIDKPAELQEAA